MKKFEVKFLEPAKEFMDNLDNKSRKKVLFNIWKSREINDPELFKKLKGNIWEFRTKFLTKQIRLFAFWDKRDDKSTLVIGDPRTDKENAKNAEKRN